MQLQQYSCWYVGGVLSSVITWVLFTFLSLQLLAGLVFFVFPAYVVEEGKGSEDPRVVQNYVIQQ